METTHTEMMRWKQRLTTSHEHVNQDTMLNTQFIKSKTQSLFKKKKNLIHLLHLHYILIKTICFQCVLIGNKGLHLLVCDVLFLICVQRPVFCLYFLAAKLSKGRETSVINFTSHQMSSGTAEGHDKLPACANTRMDFQASQWQAGAHLRTFWHPNAYGHMHMDVLIVRDLQ